MWQIIINFDTLRVKKGEIDLDNKAPRATPTITLVGLTGYKPVKH